MFYYLINSELNETSAVFRVEGPDANTYLQGQFTQELNRPVGAESYGLFLNQKGKVVADAHILRKGAAEFELVSFSLKAPQIRERLEAYLIADDVSLGDMTNGWARISLWGDEAEAATAKLTGWVPELHAWSESKSILGFHGRRSAGQNFELLVPRADARKIVAELQGMGGQEVDFAAAECERIVSGIPAVPADIGPGDLPNEGGLDEVAISYTKGCYLGQEVMARLKNLGQVRRRLHLLRGAGEPPVPGTALFQGGNKVGEFRSVARDGKDFVAMAMLSLVHLSVSDRLARIPDSLADITIIRRV